MKRIIYVLAIALLMSSTAFAQKKDKKAKKNKQEGFPISVILSKSFISFSNIRHLRYLCNSYILFYDKKDFHYRGFYL